MGGTDSIACNLARSEARSLVVSATVAESELVRMAFAWKQAEAYSALILELNAAHFKKNSCAFNTFLRFPYNPLL